MIDPGILGRKLFQEKIFVKSAITDINENGVNEEYIKIPADLKQDYFYGTAIWEAM